ncbi:hypothetical protein ACMD2_18392 [Ananas comosus]|uniref:ROTUNDIFOLIA like 8 n=1 Tax=Ananas comosus TaxID=4615 RepID=A0A199VPG8_ANACO|nr:hypothetical protein ACMD2_18392 [Ananas comosus]
MELYMDEKWKLTKKGSRGGSRRVAAAAGDGLKRSASARDAGDGRRSAAAAAAAAAASPASFSSRCASLFKEQRARFYIMRRCVTMLICWRDYP